MNETKIISAMGALLTLHVMFMTIDQPYGFLQTVGFGFSALILIVWRYAK